MTPHISVYGPRARLTCLAVSWLVPLLGACSSSGGDAPPSDETSTEGTRTPSAESEGDTTTLDTNSSGANATDPRSDGPTTRPSTSNTDMETSASNPSTIETPPVENSSGPTSTEVGSSTAPQPTTGAPSMGTETSTDDAVNSSTATEPSTDTGPLPQIPEVSGTCPTFETGTVTVSGLGGIALQVGPKKNGTGSLVFYWHGTGSSAGEVNTFLPRAVRDEILDAGGIIVSFDDSTGTGGDCSGTSTFSKDDFEIADLIAACAVRDHGIDPRRIYTTGCSAGGLQAGCMGAMRSSYIAAVAPNSGGEVSRQPIEDPSHTPAVMTMHGGSSDVVVVAFSRTSATYDAHMKEAGSFVVNCDHGGGHCRAPSDLYSAAWEFMKAHPFGVEPSPYEDGLPNSFPEYCKVY